MTRFETVGPVTRYESRGGKYWIECQLTRVAETDNPAALARNGGAVGATQWTYTASWGGGALAFGEGAEALATRWEGHGKPYLATGPALAGF